MLNWKPWVAVCVSTWSLLAFVAWHYESTCGVFLSGACFGQYWDALRWLVLLKWVHPYQTLIGGAAAVAAGTFVLVAAKQTAEHAKDIENANRRQNAIVACSIIADEFRDAKIHMSDFGLGYASYIRPKYSFVHSSTYMPSLHSIDPMLGSVVSAARRDIEEHFATNAMSPSFKANDVASAKCLAIWHLLISVSDRLSPDGTFDLRAGIKIPAGELSRLLETLKVRPKELTGLYYLFEWQA
ncbi:hypothetical protein M1D34_07475 [Ensifer sp. D2-11]